MSDMSSDTDKPASVPGSWRAAGEGDTPRTDAADKLYRAYDGRHNLVGMSDFARTLERELAAATARAETAERELAFANLKSDHDQDCIASYIADASKLRSECAKAIGERDEERSRASSLQQERADFLARTERAERERDELREYLSRTQSRAWRAESQAAEKWRLRREIESELGVSDRTDDDSVRDALAAIKALRAERDQLRDKLASMTPPSIRT